MPRRGRPPRKVPKKRLEELRALRHERREASTDYDNPNQVMTFDQWCRRNNFSHSTGKRVLGSGQCEYVQLSERRIGVTVGAHRKYQQRTTRKAG